MASRRTALLFAAVKLVSHRVMLVAARFRTAELTPRPAVGAVVLMIGYKAPA